MCLTAFCVYLKVAQEQKRSQLVFSLTGRSEVIDCRHRVVDALIPQTWSPYNSPDTLARTHTHAHTNTQTLCIVAPSSSGCHALW